MIFDHGFWQSFPEDSHLTGVMVEWQRTMGKEFARGREFLKPTTEQSEDYPCLSSHPPCGCTHKIYENEDGLVAACTCDAEDYSGCQPFKVERKDLLVYAVDLKKVGEGIRRALKLEEISAPSIGGAHAIGRHPHGYWPVYFWVPPSYGAMVKMINRFTTSQTGPAMVLVPWGSCVEAEVKTMLARQGIQAVGVEQMLAPGEGGDFAAREGMAAKLAEVEKGLASHRGVDAVVKEIKQDIAVVAREFRDMKTVKERLAQMQGEKLFAFVNGIDPDSFRVLCGILAHGDVAKASRALNLSDSTLRSRMADWEMRGPAYRVLVELVRWRKEMGRKGTVPLNEAITKGTAASTDFAGLLSDVLDEVLEMDEENWEEKAEALGMLLRPHVTR